MDLQKLFSLQKMLDDRIADVHHLHGEPLIAERILALQVELAELANETRCFKFWSNKSASPRNVLLEEYVDGVHFILSIGLALQFTDMEVNESSIVKPDSLIECFLDVTSKIIKLNQEQSYECYLEVFYSYMGLGKSLGFTPQEIEAAYVSKNNVNHQRQDEGY